MCKVLATILAGSKDQVPSLLISICGYPHPLHPTTVGWMILSALGAQTDKVHIGDDQWLAVLCRCT